MKKIIFRMDDISPDMNYEKFALARDIFKQYNVRPLIGVIPNNKDNKLIEARAESASKEDADIWKEIKALQDDYGWEIALHGYEHKTKNTNGGILNINSKSEFAGLPYEEQFSYIQKGIKILESRGLIIVAFMAPSHSFDYETLKALKKQNITNVTDGKGVYPYYLKDSLMMPVPYSIYRKLPFGIYTVCLHTNSMKDKDFVKLCTFIEMNRHNVISFSEGVQLYQQKNNLWMKMINIPANYLMVLGVKALKIVSKLRHRDR